MFLDRLIDSIRPGNTGSRTQFTQIKETEGSVSATRAQWSRVKGITDKGDRLEVYISAEPFQSDQPDVRLWSAWGKARDHHGRSLLCKWIEIRLLDSVNVRAKNTAFAQILKHPARDRFHGSAIATFKIDRSRIRLEATLDASAEPG